MHCWGNNALVGPGDGTVVERHVPTAVVSVGDAVGIAAGSAHSCALRQSGTVACWDYNGFGQLGDGTTTNRLTAVAVAGLAGVKAISARGTVSCALKQDGTALNRLTPVAVTGGSLF